MTLFSRGLSGAATPHNLPADASQKNRTRKIKNGAAKPM
jgi:hypothetical protein